MTCGDLWYNPSAGLMPEARTQMTIMADSEIKMLLPAEPTRLDAGEGGFVAVGQPHPLPVTRKPSRGKIKDIPRIDRPRERFLKKGPGALSKSDLLAILLGSGIRGKNVRQLSQQIIKKFGNGFLDVAVDDLKTIDGIGEAKALQIVAAISLVKRYYEDIHGREVVIGSLRDVISQTTGLRDRKKEHLVCLYLNARNVLLKKETVSVGLVDKTLVHPREVFQPATEINASGVILVHNHPSGDPSPSTKDFEIVRKIAHAGEIMGIPVIDFVVISDTGEYSFHGELKDSGANFDYVASGDQATLFDLLEIEKPAYEISAERIHETHFNLPKAAKNRHQLHNRRYIGSKYKLIEWIFSVLDRECAGYSFMDIFAGTGVVSAVASIYYKKVIINDFLYSNEVIYKAFFAEGPWHREKVDYIINSYNSIGGEDLAENYFSLSFGGKYFSKKSAKVIGAIRDNIEENRGNLTDKEYWIMIASLLYSADKIANTVGHYDAYFKKPSVEDRFIMRPVEPVDAGRVSIYREDANILAKRVKADVVYIDPPYNSRQYSRFYHVLETLTKWDQPKLHGVALKPEPENMSDYCRVSAKNRFAELVNDVNAKYLVVSYNNTYDPKSKSSKNRITLREIKKILGQRGETKVFEKRYRHFNAGNTDFSNHKEYLFVTEVIT